MTKESIIHIEGLTKDFGIVRAVDNLSLDVRVGTAVGFLGPNGAGKTTTIKILTNLIEATSGKAYLNGVDVTKDPRRALSCVGAVVETPEFYPFLTPMETMAYLGRVRGMSQREIEKRSRELLATVKLDKWMDKRIGKFSKGMKQRLAVAQALLHEPEILILDEPTTGLDPRGMVEIREILKQLRNEGYTIFMSSHLLPEVQETCDYVAMIDYGKLLVYDSVEKLSTMANMNKIEIDLAEAPSKDSLERVSSFAGVKSIERVTPLRLYIEYSADPSTRHLLLKEMLDAGLKVNSFNPKGLALENLYMQMIRESR
ncbi:MAG: ABC transporter ATP-binding protein [Thermoplasmata archaeon]